MFPVPYRRMRFKSRVGPAKLVKRLSGRLSRIGLFGRVDASGFEIESRGGTGRAFVYFSGTFRPLPQGSEASVRMKLTLSGFMMPLFMAGSVMFMLVPELRMIGVVLGALIGGGFLLVCWLELSALEEALEDPKRGGGRKAR